MTEPLTPPDCDLTDFAFMPLDVDRLRDSELATEETPESCWAAVMLWCVAWHQIPAASIPDNDKWIATKAGYAQRGKIAREWDQVRDGALRGFIKCSDGRLYHPVVAEKAVEAWESKRDQRWRTECARIKKHNDRHHTAIPRPTFDEWVSQGCPQGQRLFVPGDQAPPEMGHGVETDSKGQGEGQGQGDSSEPKGSAGAGAPPAVDRPTESETRRQLWADSGAWLVSNGLTAGDAKAFMNTLAKDYPAVVAEALREAIKTEAPVDVKAFTVGVAQRLAGLRKDPITVPSTDTRADQFKAAMDERAATATRPPAAVLALARKAVRTA